MFDNNARSRAPNIREEVLSKVLEALENGVNPWESSVVSAIPYNHSTGAKYRGINMLNLALRDRSDPRWMTFNQAKQMGFSIRAGSKSAGIQIWKMIDKNTKKELDAADIKNLTEGMSASEKSQWFDEHVQGIVKHYRVFNGEDIVGLKAFEPVVKNEDFKIQQADRIHNIIANSEAKIVHSNNVQIPHYSISTDEIHMPEHGRFKTAEGYYGDLFHEIAHSTGAESRLNRALGGDRKSKEYAKEELVAEIASFFTMADLQMEQSQERLNNCASYLASWLELIKEDSNVLYNAIKDANRASDYILSYEKASAKVVKNTKENSLAEQLAAKAVLQKEETAAERRKRINDENRRNYYRNKKQRAIRLIDYNVPEEMKALDQWCAFINFRDPKTGKNKKLIWNVNFIPTSEKKKEWAKCDDPSTWASFEKAKAYALENKCDGLSFVLRKENNITCIDLDNHIAANGQWSEDLKRLIYNSKTFVESSYSGRGAHIFLKGHILNETTQKKNDETRFECYDDVKIISMTGKTLNNVRKLGEVSEPFKNFVRAKLGEAKVVSQAPKYQYVDKTFVSTSDVLEKIQNSKVANEFNALMSGQNLLNDHSRSDLKLMNILAFFTKGNKDQMLSIFTMSGLYRKEKGQKYLDRTANVAINTLVAAANKIKYQDKIEKAVPRARNSEDTSSK